MSFFAVLLALMLEQGRPLPPHHPARQGFSAWAVSVRRWVLQGGWRSNTWLAWGLAVLPATLLTALLYWLLLWLAWPLALLFSVLVLYACLGFQQCSLHLHRIRNALANEDWASAQQAWQNWHDTPQAPPLSAQALLRQAMSRAVLQAQHQVFAVLFWFTAGSLLGLGPAAVVLYRSSGHIARRWQLDPSPVLQQASGQFWGWLNWLPARLTAIGFAIVGSFDSAMDTWRVHANAQPQDHQGIVLAAASGALELGPPHADKGDGLEDSEAVADEMLHIDGLTSLTRRLVAMWLLLLALLTLGRLLG